MVIFHARDGCYRDMASIHGSYRKLQETIDLAKAAIDQRVRGAWLVHLSDSDPFVELGS